MKRNAYQMMDRWPTKEEACHARCVFEHQYGPLKSNWDPRFTDILAEIVRENLERECS